MEDSQTSLIEDKIIYWSQAKIAFSLKEKTVVFAPISFKNKFKFVIERKNKKLVGSSFVVSVLDSEKGNSSTVISNFQTNLNSDTLINTLHSLDGLFIIGNESKNGETISDIR